MSTSRTKVFTYKVPRLRPDEFPRIPKPKGARLACSSGPPGNVDIKGNSAGLLYLAKHLVAMAFSENRSGLHEHLTPHLGQLDDTSDELTIHNEDLMPAGQRTPNT